MPPSSQWDGGSACLPARRSALHTYGTRRRPGCRCRHHKVQGRGVIANMDFTPSSADGTTRKARPFRHVELPFTITSIGSSSLTLVKVSVTSDSRAFTIRRQLLWPVSDNYSGRCVEVVVVSV